MSAASLPEQVVNAIRNVVGEHSEPLHAPSFNGNEWQYLKECLDSTYVSSVGKFVDRFEEQLASYTEAKHVVAVVNGTAALHIALKLAGVKQGDEVLIPTLTFVATANAISYCAATPHFVDSEAKTLGIDTAKLRDYLIQTTQQHDGRCINKKTGNVISAILPMHAFGHPSDLDELLAIARDFNIVLVEDAAESLGSYYRGKHTGTLGSLGVLSFNGNKTITTGGGGAILTNRKELAQLAKHLTTTAKVPHQWEFVHDEIGYNYRMPNINAALGCAQLEQLPEILTAKRALYQRYKTAFSGIDGLTLVSEPEHCQSNYWLQTLLLNNAGEHARNEILKATNESGFMTRPAWTLMHKLKIYSHCPTMNLDMAEALVTRIINIPSSASL